MGIGRTIQRRIQPSILVIFGICRQTRQRAGRKLDRWSRWDSRFHWPLRRSTGNVRDRQLQILIARLRQQRCRRPHTNITANRQWVPNFRSSRLCTSIPATHLRHLGQRAVVPESRNQSLLRSSSNFAAVLGSSVPPYYANSMRNPQASPPSRLLC